MPDRTFSIGELCAEFDVTPRALRFYEYKELLSPIRDGQRRIFTSACRARLKLILRGKRFGFSLAEIKDLLDLYRPGEGQMQQLTATLDAAEGHLKDLTAKRDELDGAIQDLRVQMELIKSMIEEKSVARAAE